MQYDVSDLVVKTLEIDDGDIEFAIKATVQNLSDDSDVSIYIQCIDEDDFEIYSFFLDSTIAVGETDIITTRETIPYSTFQQIKDWKVSS